MDRACTSLAARVKWQIQQLMSPPTGQLPDRLICSRLIASLRAGVSLDSAVSSATHDDSLPAGARERLRYISEGKPGRDFLSTYLTAALRTGMPVLGTLQIFQQILAARHRLQLRSRSLTGQARAQAEVLSWLPWTLAGVIFLVDGEWFALASHQALAWFLWSVAIALTGLGRKWMRRQLTRALEPASPDEALEENELPELTLRLIAEISMGTDAETALERSLGSVQSPALNRAYAAAGPEKLLHLKAILRHAAATGAPLRDDLQTFLQNLYLELESRWEERVQRLPVTLLMPLFICFFPGTLLVIGSLLFPLLRELQ
jgi:hypothetical protein